MYFNLDKPKQDKDTSIFLMYWIGGKEKQFKYSTGLTANPKDWNFQAKMPNARKGRLDLSILSRKLQPYADFMTATISNLELNDIPITKAELKQRFDEKFREKEKKIEFNYFTDWVDDFIKRAPNTINRKTGAVYNADNIKLYSKVNNRLKEFEKFRGQRIRLKQFDFKVHDELIFYLKNERKYSANYIGDIIKVVKKFLSVAKVKVLDYKEFSVLKEETLAPVLNENEIDILFAYDFSYDKRFENIRDWLVIGCWLGLRVSDLMALKPIDTSNDTITVMPSKTKETSKVKVVIPLHPYIKHIVNTRGMPTTMHENTFNKFVKQVCRVVGFNEVIEGSLYNGKKKRKEPGEYEKYKLISSHCMRRSFATNMYHIGFSVIAIMKITGHKKIETFLNYIKVTPEDNAEMVLTILNKRYEGKLP